MAAIRIVIWNEFIHEQRNAYVKKLYPQGMHQALAVGLGRQPEFEIATATLEEPEHGLSDEVLARTDVLMWWGHVGHGKVADETVERIHQRVLEGMGMVVMHSGHYSKIFRRLMGTGCGLRWREAGEKERLWVVNPTHPITRDLAPYIEIPQAEMYGEHFDIPEPDELLFISWFEGGEVFRSGAVWRRGRGRIFYFRPGHETYPIFYQPEVLAVLANGIRWVGEGGGGAGYLGGRCKQIPLAEALEALDGNAGDPAGLEHPEAFR